MSCGSQNVQYSVIDLNGLTLWSITEFESFQLPQSVVTSAKLSKYRLLVNRKHITIHFLNNIEITIENSQKVG